jgi:hypothetical protein
MSNPADEISQREKREVLRSDRLARNTYLAHANDTELELGGRFAKLRPTTVIGEVAVPQYPKLPAGNPWAEDVCGPEPSLGFSVDAIEPVGEAWEQEASKPPGAAEGDGPSGVGRLVTPPKFKRRF